MTYSLRHTFFHGNQSLSNLIRLKQDHDRSCEEYFKRLTNISSKYTPLMCLRPDNLIQSNATIIASISNLRSRNISVLTEKTALSAISRIFSGDNSGLSIFNLEKFDSTIEQSESVLAFSNTSVNSSMNLIESASEYYFSLASITIDSIIAVRNQDPSNKRIGFSSPLTMGWIYLDFHLPHLITQYSLALDIIHESMHQLVYYYQHCDPLVKVECSNELQFSPIRNTFRKPIGALHGIIVLSAMLHFSRIITSNKHLSNLHYEASQFLKMNTDIQSESIRIFNKSILTPLGKLLISEATN